MIGWSAGEGVEGEENEEGEWEGFLPIFGRACDIKQYYENFTIRSEVNVQYG